MASSNISINFTTDDNNVETTFLPNLVIHISSKEAYTTPLTEIAGSGSTVVVSTIYYIIGLMGIFGNGLVLFLVFKTPSLHDVTNYIIANQSLVDLFSSILFVFQYAATLAVPSSSVFVEVFCKVWLSGYLYWGAIRVSTTNLVCLTLDRYYAICHPIKYRNKKKCYPLMLITFAWVFGYVYQFPTFLTRRYYNDVCAYAWPTLRLQQAFGISFFLTQWCAPLIIMMFVYLNIVRKLRKRVIPPGAENDQQIVKEKRGNHMSDRVRRNVLKTLMIVSITYAICWGPNFSAFAYFNISGNFNFSSPYFQLTIMLASSNMSVNPIIYAFKYQRFQQAFCKLFGLRKVNLWLHGSTVEPSTLTISGTVKVQ